jgi:hypothetical protein
MKGHGLGIARPNQSKDSLSPRIPPPARPLRHAGRPAIASSAEWAPRTGRGPDGLPGKLRQSHPQWPSHSKRREAEHSGCAREDGVQVAKRPSLFIIHERPLLASLAIGPCRAGSATWDSPSAPGSPRHEGCRDRRRRTPEPGPAATRASTRGHARTRISRPGAPLRWAPPIVFLTGTPLHCRWWAKDNVRTRYPIVPPEWVRASVATRWNHPGGPTSPAICLAEGHCATAKSRQPLVVLTTGQWWLPPTGKRQEIVCPSRAAPRPTPASQPHGHRAALDASSRAQCRSDSPGRPNPTTR